MWGKGKGVDGPRKDGRKRERQSYLFILALLACPSPWSTGTGTGTGSRFSRSLAFFLFSPAVARQTNRRRAPRHKYESNV